MVVSPRPRPPLADLARARFFPLQPFDPVSKRITAEVSKNGKKYIAAKGAPNAILKLCQPPKEEADAYRQKTMQFAKRGFRSLGVALHEDGKWTLLGLLP